MAKRSHLYQVKLKPRTWHQCRHAAKKMRGDIRYDVLFGLKLAALHGDLDLFDKPVHAAITFYMPTANEKNANEKHNTLHPHTPHTAQLLHFVLDNIADVIVTKPSIICSLDVKKLYGKVPMTQIKLTEIG